MKSSKLYSNLGEKHKVLYDDKEIEFTLIKTKRRKTSELIVEDNKVIVRCPFTKPTEDVKALVLGKALWIMTKIKENKNMQPEIKKATFENNTSLAYLGKDYPLKIVKGKEDYLYYTGESFLIYYSHLSPKTIYENWLKCMLYDIVQQKLKKFSRLLETMPLEIEIKNLKSKWGSTTVNKKITINTNIMKAKEEIIEYIVLHELCHLIINDHSKKYWSLLSKYMPDYKKKIEWLETNSNNLI